MESVNAAGEPRFTILLVEDNELHRTMWSTFLKREGYDVVTAADGVEALRLIKRAPVDLVLLDIMMPVISGYEVLKLLRQRYPPDDLPVIMATAKDHSADVVKAFDLGANDYVTKPLDFPVVLVRIQAQLRGRVPAHTRPTPTRPSPRSVAKIAPGTVLEGKYRLDELLGHGHYGAVYRATHLKLRRPVAVKLLRTPAQAEDEALERLRREGISACRLEHPNVVTVLDFSVSSRVPFLVMELLEGNSLEVEIRERGPLTPLRCAVILLPICEVLAEAHSLGIVHRDIKPGNIFLQHARRGEVVKVLDFGIAKLLGDTVLDPDITVDGSGPGTPTYMAPERFSEKPYNGRADVYSVGVMLYEMLTGKPPFVVPDGNPIKMALMHMSEQPRPLCEENPELPRPLEEVVFSALEKDPEDRPSAEELARSFTQALGLELPPPLTAVAPSSTEEEAQEEPGDPDAGKGAEIRLFRPRR